MIGLQWLSSTTWLIVVASDSEPFLTWSRSKLLPSVCIGIGGMFLYGALQPWLMSDHGNRRGVPHASRKLGIVARENENTRVLAVCSALTVSGMVRRAG